MSSATSIRRSNKGSFRDKESVRLKADATREPESETDAGFRPMHFFVLASLIMATAAVILSRRSTPEHLILISVIIAAAGAAAAGFYRMLAPLAIDDGAFFTEPMSERSRAAVEREKALVLRSIKELEFDQAMGKLSPKDFDEMAGRLRARAITLMKQVDEGATGYRELIERELTARLAARAGTVASTVEGTVGRSLQTPVHEDTVGRGLQTPVHDMTDPAVAVGEPPAAAADACASCRTVNDPDAAFCKRCGTRLAAGAQ